jgi:glycosyltransferase involved in cell wall biosynthesis
MLPTPSKLPLSAVLITLDAAASLEQCLSSLDFADQILIVDSGSRDATLEIASRFGAEVINQPWLGFGPQKGFAVSCARHDWVLCLDADEWVTPELRKNIEVALLNPSYVAYQFARCNRFLGRYLRFGEGYPDWNLRLFNRNSARWSDDVVHEHVLTDTSVGTLAGDLFHDSAESLANYLGKQNRYTTLAAEAAFKAGKRTTASRLLLSPLIRFIKFYLIRQGFRDGLPGLVHIAIGCFNSFIKYAKLLELQKRDAALR